MAKKKVRNRRTNHTRRVKRGKKRGPSRTRSSGQPRKRKAPLKGKPKNVADEMESIGKLLAKGVSLTSAAKQFGVSRGRARRYISAHGIAEFESRKWVITDDRPRQVPIASRGEQKVVVVSPAEASKAGSYANAAKAAISTNDPDILEPFEGEFVKDIRGRKHKLETDLNALHRIAAADEPSWPDIYKIVV